MDQLQQIFVIGWGILALIGFSKSFLECYKKKNTNGLTYSFWMFGAFVWADMVVFGIFWILVSLISLLLNNFYLFLLFISLFWLVRSIGETIYWLSQQFSTLDKNPVDRFLAKKIFHNKSVWFVHQIFWQCITVFSLFTSIYLTVIWLKTV